MLLRERDLSGRVSLPAFYARRARRLGPALLLFLGTMGLLSVTPLSVAPSGHDLVGALTGVGNYSVALKGHDTVITHTWSLSIEQQFYLLWPALLVVALWLARGRLTVLATVTAVAVAFSVLQRFLLWDGGAGALRVYVGSDTRMDALLIGCLAGLWLHGRTPGVDHPRIAVAAIGVICVLGLTTGAVALLVVPTLVPWLGVAGILALVRQEGAGWLARPAIRLVGERSYGLFLWHYPLFGVAVALPGRVVVPALVVAALLAFGMAHLSWHCVEMPFMRGRHRPSGDGDSVARGVPRRRGTVRLGA
ncbi:hypothetical protein BH10ACT10_BH10ACT10_11040 [soil metagenome]